MVFWILSPTSEQCVGGHMMLSPLCCITVLLSTPPSILCDFGSCGILALFGTEPFTPYMEVALFSDSYSSSMILIVFLRDLSYE